MWETSPFLLHTLLSMSFDVNYLIYFLPPLKWHNCWMTRINIVVLLWVVFCVMISWVKGLKYKDPLQFNTSWLTSLRMWYHFRLCFRFSCSDYDLTLIKTSHTLNCYSFFQKFLLKTKTYKLVVGTVLPQFTTEATYSETAIYFFSLMFCSINKLKLQVKMHL